MAPSPLSDTGQTPAGGFFGPTGSLHTFPHPSAQQIFPFRQPEESTQFTEGSNTHAPKVAEGGGQESSSPEGGVGGRGVGFRGGKDNGCLQILLHPCGQQTSPFEQSVFYGDLLFFISQNLKKKLRNIFFGKINFSC